MLDDEAEAFGSLPLRCSRGEAFYTVLRTPAMGDPKVPDIAQLAHQYTLRKCGLLTDDAWMLYGRAPPTGQSWEGVYIDDHVAVGILRRGHHATDRTECMRLAQEGEAVYAEKNLLRHEWCRGARSMVAAERLDLPQTRCARSSAPLWRPLWRICALAVCCSGCSYGGCITFCCTGRTFVCCRRPYTLLTRQGHGSGCVCRRPSLASS